MTRGESSFPGVYSPRKELDSEDGCPELTFFFLPSLSFAVSRSGHQFFVDTKANPPRSIWTHPFDDEEYIRSIPDSQSHQPSSQQQYGREATPSLSQAEIHERRQAQDNRTKAADAAAAEKHENRSLGEKIKDKLTGSTKAERDAEKRKKIAAERVSLVLFSINRILVTKKVNVN